MRTTSRDASGSLRAALVRWPAEQGRREALAASGIPRLLVIDPHTAIPLVAADEDWISSGSDERDVAVRLRRLASPRSATPIASVPVLPEELSADERRVASRLLVVPGALVPVEDLDVADPRRVIESLRRQLRPLGHVICAVGDVGYLIEPALGSAP